MWLLVDHSAIGRLRVALLKQNDHSTKQRVYHFRSHADGVFFLYVTRFLNSIGVSFAQLEGVAVINGAGSFTCARLAVSMANTIGWLYDLPVRRVKVDEKIFMSKNDKREKRFTPHHRMPRGSILGGQRNTNAKRHGYGSSASAGSNLVAGFTGFIKASYNGKPNITFN